ncbi:MAG: type II secretion system protein [Candidatus Paceibacterota bacterium]
MQIRRFRKAFTLIELLVTIAIVGILSGFIFISMSSALNAAKDAKRQADLSTISKAVLEYYAEHTAYPYTATTTACNLCTSDSCSNPCTGFYANIQSYLPSIPIDPTGTYYTYTYTATPKFVLQATLSSGFAYKYDSLSGFATVAPFTSTCAAASNAQVTCASITINSTEEACRCIYVSGAGQTNFTVSDGITSIRYLVVGGGGGGHILGGGGGGGGYRSSIVGETSGGGGSAESPLTVSTGNVLSITVGAGGAAGSSQFTPASSGGNSVFGSITSVGGGGGGGQGTNGVGGGSGGGAGNDGVTLRSGGGGTSMQGYAGGGNHRNSPYPGGGGGGAGAIGGTATAGVSGAGGSGQQSSITGAATYYAGGGGGASELQTIYGAAGAGGGGSHSAGIDGLGGGGSGNFKGGSGIVIFRYNHP